MSSETVNDDLLPLRILNDLKTTTASSPSNSNSSTVQSKVTNIGNLLDEAVSVRISKDLLDSPKTQALVLANLGNEITMVMH